MNPSQRIEFSKNWLTQNVFPLWSEKGIDRKNGGFVESLTFEGEPMDLPRRAMVQSRQIYSFLTGLRMKTVSKEVASFAVQQGAKYMVEKFSQPSGAFIYSVNPDGTPKSLNPDLYTQAFALFGLAQAYRLDPKPEYKSRAKELVKYLYRERSVKAGGFTELDEKGTVSYKSNPHMHMFESAIAWMQIDKDPEWWKLGEELAQLAITKFIDSHTGVLGEYFDENWNHLRENGRFIYEPGHQFEWSWLFSLYQELTGKDCKAIRHNLFLLAEKHGTDPVRKIAYDEMWSDFTPKLISSRFWPQCERIKAAVRLGTEVPANEKAAYQKGADDGMDTLFKFFETPKKGMWYDQLSAQDTFSGNSSKSSSLYHIINALEEYVNLRN
ncbi:AGE family epimerase/isomerase [Bdellovibrio sp. KM01]|uniref:AGE family epimerase/isomerase n=1 Tax=Bdellovibrio sp. KM01 TaxID=2748865 RepID=UPI0015EB09E7|nr:AGE family epimerase/isomerase [Bdellovibrio sp. KM01]QLY25399.1 AGE family epimerase/isomerase [Bdellovibrio sp. KM01]